MLTWAQRGVPAERWRKRSAADLCQGARALWQRILHLARRKPGRRLRLLESLPLGERRFVAVVEFERSRFLLGGTPASLVLLAPLEPAPHEKETMPLTPSEAGVDSAEEPH